MTRATSTAVFRLFLAVSALAACAPRAVVKGDEVQKKGLEYKVGVLPPGWRTLRLEENDLALVHEGTEHSLAVNSTCEGYDDASLEVLTRHLLMGFTEVQTLTQEKIPLDGREALRSHFAGKMDGVPVELGIVVLKKDGCIYDFTYVSPPGHYDDQVPVFDAVLERFHAEKKP